MLLSSHLSNIHHHRLNTQRYGLSHCHFNGNNKQMALELTLDFVWDHYDTFFVLAHQSPLGDSERPSTAVHDHFLIQWQLNWRLDGLLSKTMSCFWVECFSLISLDALGGLTRADMLTTSLVILGLSSTSCPASQISEGKETRERWESSLGLQTTTFHMGLLWSHTQEWQHALSHTHKVPGSDTLTPEPGISSPANAKQTLYSASSRKHNYIWPTAYN